MFPAKPAGAGVGAATRAVFPAAPARYKGPWREQTWNPG